MQIITFTNADFRTPSGKPITLNGEKLVVDRPGPGRTLAIIYPVDRSPITDLAEISRIETDPTAAALNPEVVVFRSEIDEAVMAGNAAI